MPQPPYSVASSFELEEEKVDTVWLEKTQKLSQEKNSDKNAVKSKTVMNSDAKKKKDRDILYIAK